MSVSVLHSSMFWLIIQTQSQKALASLQLVKLLSADYSLVLKVNLKIQT